MVRETRHLWVGNLPENVSKERIKEYFNRYGPVQSVKPLPGNDGAGEAPTAVTVAFMDIKSACKALQTPHKLEERVLKTDFYDPASGACGSGSCPPAPEEKGGGPGGGGTPGPKSSGDVNRPVGGGGHWRHGSHQDNQGGRDYQNRNNHQARYQDPDQFRHRSRMPYRNGNFGQDGVRGNATYRNNYGWKDSRGREGQYGGPNDKQEPQSRLLPVSKTPANSNATSTSAVNALNVGAGKKKQRARKSKSSESGSDSQQSGSNSRSSSSSSSRSSSSGSGSSKSPSPDRRASKRMGGGMQGGNFLPHTEFDKQCTIVVRNLPERPSEAAVKEELNREYKKGGCVVREVRVVDKKREGGVTRSAIITFSDPADVSKALEDSRNKRILGSLIDVEKLNSHSGDDRSSREGEYSEFHNRATRTLFVGNISREVVPSEIHERFKEFGEILEIDIKKPDYALVQFVDIKSVLKAMRGMSSEMIAGQRVRLGFGLSVATKCVWCDGVGAEVTEKMLQVEFSQYGKIQDLIVDRSRGHALVYFDQLKKATIAVKEMRGRSIMGCRLQTDYASHECRAAFFDHCKKSGMDIRERAKPWEQDQNQGDKRERLDRKPRERSTESRGSGAGGGRGRKRDEYDEELRRFQSERGKFDETDRCFTPPYGGVRRSVPSTGGLSRSPSPLPRSTRSPGQQSRSGGHDRSAFSDRESVVSDGSRHGSPVSRDGWRGSRYKPRVQAISPPGDSRSPADHDDTRRGSKRYREEERRSGGRPQDPRVVDHVAADKKHFKPGGVDSGMSEETSSGSSGSVPDVDNAKLPGARGNNSVKQPPNRRTSTDSASASMDGSSRPATPSMAMPFSTGTPSLLRVATTEEGYTAPRTPVSPPPSSDGSRPGTPLCDENPENLMSRSAAAPVRLASHLRTQNNSSEPMSLPLPRFAHVLSTSPGDRTRPQISPRDSRESGSVPPTQPGLLKHPTRPDLAKLSILSPTKFPNGPPEPPRARDPRLKSPAGEPSPAPTTPSLKSPVSVPGGTKQATFLSPGSSTPTNPAQPSPGHKPKDPRQPVGGLLAVAVPTAVAASPLSPLPRPARHPQEGSEPPPAPVAPESKSATSEAGPLELEERLKLLDEKYVHWSSLTRVPGSGPGREGGGGRYNLDIKPAQPSAIVQKLLSRKSVFDEDSKRLENINEKYDPSEEENGESGGLPPVANYNTISTLPLKSSMQEPPLSAESPIANAEPVPSALIVRDLPSVPPMLPSSPVKVAALHRPSMSPRMYLPQVQSPKTLDESSRPLPLPYRAGTPATMGSNPIKPLVDKLSKPAAFTKPSATVTPTLKSTGFTASTSVRSNVFTTTSTKTVSTCTMAPGNLSHPHIGVEKGEASSTTCSPKPDSALTEVSSSPTIQAPPQETDSDPNVTSTTGTEQKKKLEANRDIRTMKKELDSLTSLKEKRDLGEELLFAPSATIMQAKTKYDKSEKKKSNSIPAHDILKDVKRAKDKIKSNREKKDKMKVKQKNDLKDFLSATATIRKEAKKEESKKEEKRDQQPEVKKQESKNEDKPVQKRRLSSNSEVEEAEPKSKIPKLKVESDCEPEVKKLKSEPMTPMGRIPKLAKKEPERKETSSTVRSSEGSKERPKSTSSHSKPDSKSKSKHDDRHAHRLPSSSDKVDDRKRDKHKKKKKEKDKEREKEDKLKKQDKSKSRSHSTDDERHHKKLKKSKDSKKKDERERPSSKGDKKDKVKREDKEKDRAREKNMSKEEREKEKAKRRHKEMVEEQRRMFEQLRKKKKLENGNGDSDGDDSSDDEANFSIFDEPVFDENNPIYFSMYDKVKARRSCVKAKEEEEARRQEEALNKFAKLKAQRAKREGKKKSVDSDDDSMDEDDIGQPRMSSPFNSEDGTAGSLNKKNSSLLNSSSDSENDLNGQVKKEPKLQSGSISNDEKKRSFKPKPRALDSSDEESPSGSRKPRSKLHPGLDSSESEDMADDEKKAEAKPRKLPIYSDSESEIDSLKNSCQKRSGSESEVTDSKASALAVLAMNKKKAEIKQEVKNEPLSSDGDTEPTSRSGNALEELTAVKKEIKTEDGAEQKLHKKKTHHIKKEKKRDRESKEVVKEKSLLGQKLKMAKIFGTSSEDEGNSRNSKPPTPNTSGGKTLAAKTMAKGSTKPRMPRMESENSDTEKRLDSPALMSDSDDDVPSRPPTPTFPAAKTGPKPQEPSKAKEQVEGKEAVKAEEVKTKKDEFRTKAKNESSEDELLPKETKKEFERNRRLSAHDRQKESENLFDSLLTVNVDLPAKSTSWKSPGGSLKSPNVKSPNKVSPGVAKTQSSGSPGSHRSPLVSPGGKPTYLLAHMFGGGDRSAREAEKIHRAQEREMHKKGSDRITKETFKTKKDLDDDSSIVKQDEERSEPVLLSGDSVPQENDAGKSLIKTTELVSSHQVEQGKKKMEAKSKEKSLKTSSSSNEVEVEKEVKSKLTDLTKCKEDGKVREKKARIAEDVEKKSGRERSKEEKKTVDASQPKPKSSGDRSSPAEKEKEEDKASKKKEARPEVTETQPKLAKGEKTAQIKLVSPEDSVFDFKDEVEVVGTLKPSSLDPSKAKHSKGLEKAPPVVVDVPTTPPESPTASLPNSSGYASFAASTKIEATSSPGPNSEDDDAPLLIIADDSEVTEVTPDDDEVTEVKQDSDQPVSKDSSANEVENAEDSKSSATSNAKQLKSSESSEQEQLEKSIASITGDARRDTVDSMDTEAAALTSTVEQKRTVISQEETENAINALLGESFESFEPEPEPEPAAPVEVGAIEPSGDDEAAAAVAGLADDEAASAVLGLAEAGDWHTNVSKQQEDESIENIAAEIRRSSTESERRLSSESSKSDGESSKTEKTLIAVHESKKAADVEVEEILKPAQRPTEETSPGPEDHVKSKPENTEEKVKKPAEDVFDFKVDEETAEPPKTIERPKQTAAPTTSAAVEVEKSSQDAPVVPAKVGTARDSTRLKTLATQAQAIQNVQVVQPAQTSPVSAPVPSPSSAVGRESPLVLQRLSTEEKSSPPMPLASPKLPLASPNSEKSPKPRARRSTGGKSRESEEESPDTLQKINLILEQAKQEAERSQAHQSQAQVQHQLVSLPAAFRTAEGGALLAAQPGAPVQDLLIDPKTGQVVGRQAAPNSVTLTLVTSTAQDQAQHSADLRVAVAPPRTGVPQPTVLPPRHDQQVRPSGGPVPRVVAAAPRPPRPPLPIQLPTQPLPPESVRKAQPVLLEQNQPSKLVQSRPTPLPVSLPTEPVPRSVAAASQLPNLPRTPLPFSSAAMVSSSGGAALRLVTTQPMISRAQPAPGWQPSPASRPQNSSIQETGQRVSLNKRDKDPELETKTTPETSISAGQPGPLKVRGDYLQPRDREVINRPASTPLSTPSPMVASQHQYEVPAAHLASASAAQYEAELVRLASYRDLTLIYQQLLSQGHPEHVAQNMAQSILRERYDTYRHEEARPGSVPPTMALHHMEEQMRRQQMPQSVRQPLPAHTSQVDAYRQTESPHQAVYMGAHPAYQAHQTHLDSYRRPGLGPEPPAAHSGQSVARLTQSPAVSDYSISRPSSPVYNPSVSDYRLPHLAAYPICWSGTLGLKNDMANVRMHYVAGNRDLAKASLPDTGSTLKIVQRMRLEDSQLDGVARKMETKSEHCMLLALPNGSEHEEIEHQSKILRSNFITYLQLKSAAGIVNVSNEDNQPAYIVHVFPSCDFANENLARIAPNLLHRVADIEHLVIVIATVFDVNR